MVAKKLGDFAKAQVYYERALQIVKKFFGDEHPKIAMYEHNLGILTWHLPYITRI